MIFNATASFQLRSRCLCGSSLVDLGIFGLHLSFALRWHMVFPISSPLIGTHFGEIDVEMAFSDRDVTRSEGWYHVIPFFMLIFSIYNMPSFGDICWKSRFTRINDTVNDASFFVQSNPRLEIKNRDHPRSCFNSLKLTATSDLTNEHLFKITFFEIMIDILFLVKI